MLHPQVRRVILYVQNMDAQIRFYRNVLGLPLEAEQKEDYSDEFWVTFATGECELALHGGGGRNFGDDTPKICFSCDELETERQRLIDAGVKVGDIREAAAGVRVLDFWDVEGNRLALESHAG